MYRATLEGDPVGDVLVRDWGFPDANIASTLVADCFPDRRIEPSTKVDLLTSNEALDMWQTLKDELRTRNRFFATRVLDLELIRDAIENQENVIKSGQKLYRGRLALPGVRRRAKEMAAPPAGKAAAGRANPDGISYLYLGDSKDTCIGEVRASIADEVAIAEFKTIADLHIVDLSFVDGVQFCTADSPSRSILAVHLLRKLSYELSLPVRRSSGYVDQQYSYLPTQFLCEYIKSLGYHGVRYPSALNPGGTNLVLFEHDLTRINNRTMRHYRVSALSPKTELVP
ncbi:RES family NAD+ phosphorylase [Brachybacterium squillarum]|uniref:RES family NAD+ phosphorylase n=1 Tax=Brachybacterium squillarum TaxID=661979 RepID=UPI0015844B95|nr:RES family NAD+ phosphorylase [Brachybacterium squillarum]